MATSSRDQCDCCYRNWIAQQHQDMDELVQTLSSFPEDNEKLNSLAEKCTKHFEDYTENRARLSKHDGSLFMSPPWGTVFENSFMWIGGCRPSLYIRLVLSLSGTKLEARLDEYLNGKRKGDLAEISADQLSLINDLQIKTVKDEDKLSSQMATKQEDIADMPLVYITICSSQAGKMSGDVDKAMDAHALTLSTMLIAADKLRVSTTKELMHILTPLQRVDFLAAAKKLHLSLHERARIRDEAHKIA